VRRQRARQLPAGPLDGPALDQAGRLEEPRPARTVGEPAVEPALGAVACLPAQPGDLAYVGGRVLESEPAAADAADRTVGPVGAEDGVDVVQQRDGAVDRRLDVRVGARRRTPDVQAHRHAHHVLDVHQPLAHVRRSRPSPIIQTAIMHRRHRWAWLIADCRDWT
jgi:hypothetical protein